MLYLAFRSDRLAFALITYLPGNGRSLTFSMMKMMSMMMSIMSMMKMVTMTIT